MSFYNRIGRIILKRPNIPRPHVKTHDITNLDFAKMKEMGMEKVLIKNVNVLTEANK